MNIFMGIVEGRKDPLALGRVQVRVFGVHTDENTYPGIPNSMLAWSTVMTPTTGSSMSGIGQNPNIVEGTMVIVLFNDESMQDCIVLGTVPGLNQEYLYKIAGKEIPRGDPTVGFQDPAYPERSWYPWPHYTGGTDKIGEDNGKSDVAFGAQEEQYEFGFERYDDPEEKNPLFTFQEPEDLRKHHKYPHNQVRQSERGHFEEWDDTYGNERLNRQHRSGTFEEIRPDGTRVQKIVNEDYTIISTNQYVHIKATCPHPRTLEENYQLPYTSDIWNWQTKNDPPDTSEFGKCGDETKFGRHVHVEGVDDLYVRRNRNVWVEGNTSTIIMGNDDVQVLGDKGQTVTIKGDQFVDIGGSQDIYILGDQQTGVEGSRQTDITENDQETIGGNQTVNVIGNQAVNIAGNQDVRMAGNQNTSIGGDQEIKINGSQKIGIAGNSDNENAMELSITGHQSIAISGNQEISISGGQELGIDEDQRITINEGNQYISIAKGNQSIQVHDGDQTISVDGSQYIIATGSQNFMVTDGHQSFTVVGDQMMNISGSQSVTIGLGGNQKFEVMAGNQEFSVKGQQTFSVVGTQNMLVTGAQQLAVNGIQNVDVTGAQVVNVGATQTTNVVGACTITAGGAVAITAGGIATVTAPAVAINAAATTISGTLAVGGTIVAGGLVTAPDFLAATGATLATHVHPILSGDSAPGPTGPGL